MAHRDPLGRPYRDNPPEPNRRRLLSDDEVDRIANDVRTLPLSEVGRHVMPLVTHLAVLADQTCDQCRWWVRHNRAEGCRGECTRPAGGLSPFRLSVIMEPDGLAEAHPSLVTAFDFGCRSWEEKARDSDTAQCQAAVG